jgi:hypothetical protein
MKIHATVQFEQARLYLVDQCFDAELLASINQLFADSVTGWIDNTQFAHMPGRLTYQLDNATTQAIDRYARQVATQISELLERQVEYVHSSLWLDLPGYRIPPHYDQAGYPDIALQIYAGLSSTSWEMLGTCVYRDSTPLFEMHYRPNSGYLMEYPHLIKHGLNHTIPEQYVRNSVYLRFAYK